jgi:hypothetical protein
MKPIQRSELLDLGAYEEVRERFRARVIAVKRARYVSLGPAMTVLFENRDTVLYQVQEMLRTERITNEKAIQHELSTYNELIPGDHELSATVFVEFPEREERERMLVALAGVEDDFYLAAGDERLAVIPDRRGTEPERTMAVQYVRFPLSSAAEAALRTGSSALRLGVEHPAYRAEVALAAETLASLRDDLD